MFFIVLICLRSESEKLLSGSVLTTENQVGACVFDSAAVNGFNVVHENVFPLSGPKSLRLFEDVFENGAALSDKDRWYRRSGTFPEREKSDRSRNNRQGPSTQDLTRKENVFFSYLLRVKRGDRG